MWATTESFADCWSLYFRENGKEQLYIRSFLYKIHGGKRDFFIIPRFLGKVGTKHRHFSSPTTVHLGASLHCSGCSSSRCTKLLSLQLSWMLQEASMSRLRPPIDSWQGLQSRRTAAPRSATKNLSVSVPAMLTAV